MNRHICLCYKWHQLVDRVVDYSCVPVAGQPMSLLIQSVLTAPPGFRQRNNTRLLSFTHLCRLLALALEWERSVSLGTDTALQAFPLSSLTVTPWRKCTARSSQLMPHTCSIWTWSETYSISSTSYMLHYSSGYMVTNTVWFGIEF